MPCTLQQRIHTHCIIRGYAMIVLVQCSHTLSAVCGRLTCMHGSSRSCANPLTSRGALWDSPWPSVSAASLCVAL